MLIDRERELGDGLDWMVHYAFFARAGFTEAAQARQALLVDLDTLDHDLTKL